MHWPKATCEGPRCGQMTASSHSNIIVSVDPGPEVDGSCVQRDAIVTTVNRCAALSTGSAVPDP
jgi:hypothetical protein